MVIYLLIREIVENRSAAGIFNSVGVDYNMTPIELQVWSKNVNIASSKNGGITDTNMIIILADQEDVG